jgi:hypothetical protein
MRRPWIGAKGFRRFHWIGEQAQGMSWRLAKGERSFLGMEEEKKEEEEV